MTCIVGIVQDGTVYIGGDSAGVAGWDIMTRADRKVFRNGAFLFGFTSSFRMGQLLHYAFTPPPHIVGMEIDRYMATVFIDALRACLKEGGYARKESDQEKGGTFLVGYRGHLFAIEHDYQVGETIFGYNAVGGGSQVALGALHATADLEMDPVARAERALAAAETFNNGVRSPFVIEHLTLEESLIASTPPEAEPAVVESEADIAEPAVALSGVEAFEE
jgi:ATP-dependent protease HslVU (ClpYQ) peptidase subunit